MLCQSQVFALAADTVLDGEALARILRMGHSRVPVHTPGHRTDLLGVVLVKELVLLDPDDRVRIPGCIAVGLGRSAVCGRRLFARPFVADRWIAFGQTCQ